MIIIQYIVCFVCVPQSTQRQLVKVALSGWGFFVHKLNKLAIYVLHKMCNAKYVVAKKPNLPSPYTVTISPNPSATKKTEK